jgi:nucleoside-diphosphate-sugar epimerase
LKTPHLVILGASGFLGRSMMAAGSFPMPVKAVSRKPPAGAGAGIWHAADLLVPGALDPVLGAGDVVCNLVYSAAVSGADNIKMVDNVIAACSNAGVARLIHCSTAMVAGVVKEQRVLESTPCQPRTVYEQTKWTLEQRVLEAVARGLDAAILRPTAIVGPGGLNLLKLARSLQAGNPLANYLRASLFGGRAMHIVPVQNVIQALLHVAQLPGRLAGNIYHVASDDDAANNFRTVEAALAQALGLKPRTLPLLPVPAVVLSILLRLLGQSDADPRRVYDAHELLEAGFVPPKTVLSAVQEFGESVR